MKHLNKYLLLALLSFSLSHAADNDDAAAEQEYKKCMQAAEDNLKADATFQTTSLIGGKTKVHWQDYQKGESFFAGTGHSSYIDGFQKFIHSRYNHQCNKCLVQYALKRVFNFLKKR